MKKKNRFSICLLIAIALLIFINSCKKKEEEIIVTYGIAKDIDGNEYRTVTIGTQTWMADNLKVTHYSNGESIPNITDNTAWISQTAGAYCWYNNDITNKTTYGALYNYMTVEDNRNLCPTGWHVPTDAEWSTLITNLGGQSVAGKRLKSTDGWYNNGNGTNTSGFSALPGGVRDCYPGYFDSADYWGHWWSATEYTINSSPDQGNCQVFSNIDNTVTLAYVRIIGYVDGSIVRGGTFKNQGYSVRCVKD